MSARRNYEDALQRTAARILDVHGYLWCHVANERKSNGLSVSNLKAKGVKKGVPDILCFERSHCLAYSGLAIELKIKPNKPTPEQLEWLRGLKMRGWKVAVVYDADELLLVLNQYFNLTL